MPSFADSIFLFVLALLLFGPKKLPVLARELGKWMGEFRRASNEFKMQMEDELRASEQSERQKQIAAMEAAAPIPPALDEPAEPEHPHLRHPSAEPVPAPSLLAHPQSTETGFDPNEAIPPQRSLSTEPESTTGSAPAPLEMSAVETADGARPVPIATSGSLKMMPPSTGLPTPRSSRPNAMSSLVDSIPEATPTQNSSDTESVAHGD